MGASIISGAITLASQVLQLINTEQSLKYVRQLEEAQMDLLNEKAKGYDSDDAKIEALEGQIGVLLQAVNNVFQVYAAQGRSVASGSVAASSSGGALPHSVQ